MEIIIIFDGKIQGFQSSFIKGVRHIEVSQEISIYKVGHS